LPSATTENLSAVISLQQTSSFPIFEFPLMRRRISDF